MGKSKIEWCDKTWNPITGCSPVSEGCENCYAKRMAKRLAGRCGYPKDEPFRVTFHPERLEEPLRWTKPWKVFVCSMGDLFHEKVSFINLAILFGKIIRQASQHTFLILTKRPERMKNFFSQYPLEWPEAYPHVWLGVTVENQARADERIPILLQIPAAARFVSVEPMLGPVNLGKYMLSDGWIPTYNDPDNCGGYPSAEPTNENINWIICGGETGPGARPIHPNWARNLRDQCQAAGVPFFFKQWGEWRECEPPNQWDSAGYKTMQAHGTHFVRLGKKKAGRLLDGKEWNEFPGQQ